MMQDFLKEFDLLNEAQKKAVEQIYWPSMVIAWPGTWKTQIIALKTANIIQKANINPENILITTFTEAWVIAIKKRLQKFLKNDASKVKVTTFHSFSKEVIDDFPERFIDQRALKVIDDIESFEILSKILDEKISSWEIVELFSITDRFFYLKDIKSRIWKLKQEGINPAKFEVIINNQEKQYNEALLELENNKRLKDLEKRKKADQEKYQKHIKKLRELQSIFLDYQKELSVLWYYDFSDMISFVTEKFKNDEDILAYYAEKYQFIMIDEFQDTNNAQNTIIDMILSYNKENQNIMVVWDDDQSIYRFQWANIENMLDFVLKYPDTKNIVLTQNYRSSQSILDISKNVIENNNQRITSRVSGLDKTLNASSEFKNLEENYFYLFENDIKEKFFVYNEILRLNKEKNTIAIIVKKNKQVEEWSNFLKERWLQTISKNNVDILNNHYVNLFLDFLNFVINPYFDDAKLLDFMRSSLCKIENIDVIFIARSLYQKNYSRQKFPLWIWDILKDIETDDYISKNIKNIEKIIEFKNDILALQSDLWNTSMTLFLSKIIEYLDLYEFINQNWDFNDLQDIFTLINKIKWYVENNCELKLKDILQKIELYKKFNISINRETIYSNNSNIEVLTAHSSKWLEYDYVFIPECYEWNWGTKALWDKLKLPNWISWDWLQFSSLTKKELEETLKNIAKEEERRLFFVALTRAKKWLFLTFPSFKEKLLIASNFAIETCQELKPKEIEISEDELKQYLTNQLQTKKLIKTTTEEIEFIKTFLQTYKLSPTDLNTFIEDPKNFLISVIYKYPFLSNESLIFWTVYHKVLEIAYTKKAKWDLMTLKDMQDIFVESLKKYDLTQDELQRLLKKWIDGLLWYYDIFVKNNRELLGCEVNFRFKDIEFDWVPLTWKIDKIEIIWETNKENDFLGQWNLFKTNIALVDYKTWSIKTNWSIKWLDKAWIKKPWEWKYFRQLLFYKLMVELSNDFSKNYEVRELALDFVEWKSWEYKYTPVSFTTEEYEDFKQELKDAWAKINDINFWIDLLNN